jgi:hypothetical protein
MGLGLQGCEVQNLSRRERSEPDPTAFEPVVAASGTATTGIVGVGPVGVSASGEGWNGETMRPVRS